MIRKNQINYLTIETIIEAHKQIMNIDDGTNLVSNFGYLESAISESQATFDNIELHPTLADKAATYLFHINKNHAFSDGNKRIGLTASIMFLNDNGIDIPDYSDKFLAECAIKIADNSLSKSNLISIFDVLISASLRNSK